MVEATTFKGTVGGVESVTNAGVAGFETAAALARLSVDRTAITA